MDIQTVDAVVALVGHTVLENYFPFAAAAHMKTSAVEIENDLGYSTTELNPAEFGWATAASAE